MNQYVISAYKHGAIDGALIKGVQNLGLNPGLQQLVSSGSGAVDPTFLSIGQMQPEITLDATAIKTALANLGGISGIALDSDTFFLQKMVAGGLRAGTLSHTKIVAATGIIIPVQIAASQGAEATISYRAVPTSADGSASPLVITESQSLEAGQDQVNEIYTMGSIEINGVALEGVESWTFDFGIELEIIIADGHVYPTFVGVMRRAPVITARCFDLDKLADWDIVGVVQGEADSTVKLLDQTEGGVRGSAPITFTIDAGMIHFESIDGRHGERIGGSVRITPTSDGTADIVAISGIS